MRGGRDRDRVRVPAAERSVVYAVDARPQGPRTRECHILAVVGNGRIRVIPLWSLQNRLPIRAIQFHGAEIPLYEVVIGIEGGTDENEIVRPWDDVRPVFRFSASRRETGVGSDVE